MQDSQSPSTPPQVAPTAVVGELEDIELDTDVHTHSSGSVTFWTNVKYLLGLGEESIYECGTSSYASTLILCITRSISGFLNLLVLFWLISGSGSAKIPKFFIFWVLPVPWAILTIESWAIFFCAFSSILLATCSCKAMNLNQNDVVELYSCETKDAKVAHAAGTMALTAAVLTIFALVVTPMRVQGFPLVSANFPRFLTYAVPVFTTAIDIVLGARVRYRLRTIAVPLTLTQVQQALGMFYLWLFERAVFIKFTSGMRFILLATLYNIMALAAAIFVVFIARITRLCDRAPPRPSISPHKYAI